MKLIFVYSLLIALFFTGCKKSGGEYPERELVSVSNAVKTGDWMVIYMENSVAKDIGTVFLQFDAAGTLVATRSGLPYNGTWSETNTAGSHTLTLAITTSDALLQQVNKQWVVVKTTLQTIDLKDPGANQVTVQLMKH
ncbi:MAG: hypothetical protein EOO06_14460 [Chitinophagaceae bacterium]|nr:hypothetical protein [Flavisolibacter longurius]RYY46497.1 MAG: hypothetical protein EOO06_14460 [Chitinophagaceae bacterium]